MKKLINNSLYLPFIISILKYDYFPVISTFYIIILYSDKIKSKISTAALKFFIVIFLSLRFFSAISINLQSVWLNLSQKNYNLSGKFIDLQSVFLSLNCNTDITFRYNLFGTEQILTCPHSVSYGPLFEIIGLKNNPKISTLLTTFIVFVLFFYMYVQFISEFNDDLNKQVILTLLFISPPINFLLQRMNFDIIIFLTIYFVYKFSKNQYLQNLIIVFLGLLKYYPIIFIISNLIFNLICKQYKKIKIDIFFLLVYLFSIVYLNKILGIVTNPVLPFRPDRTFGVLSMYLNFNKVLNISYFFITCMFLFILFVIIYLTKDTYVYSELFEIDHKHNFLFTFIVLALLANYDYRLGILIFLSVSFIKSLDNILFYSYVFFIMSSPGVLHSYGPLFSLVENYQIVYLDIPFLFFLILTIKEYLNFILIKLNLRKITTGQNDFK